MPLTLKKGKVLFSTNSMTVPGVIFDSKVSWANHISKLPSLFQRTAVRISAITKAEKAPIALRLISRFFLKQTTVTVMVNTFIQIHPHYFGQIHSFMFVILMFFYLFSVIFIHIRSCFMVKVCRCNLSVKFQRSCLSV